MRILAPVLLLLSGCLWGGGEASRVEDLGEGTRRASSALPAAPDRHRYGDPALLKVGMWATYREGERTLTLAVTGEEAGALWIEVIDEGEPRLVSARLTSRDGQVLKARAGEAGKAGVDQALIQSAGTPSPEPASEAESEEALVFGGKARTCRVLVRRWEDLDGRLAEERIWWSADVPPLYAGGSRGGLVKRTGRGPEVGILRWGADAKPSLAR
jgi:hypothetical protein